jgi:hypothetical protein
VPERVKHRMQVASQYCAGVASCTVPADAKLDLTNNGAVFAVCIRLGLPLPGLTSAPRCLRNCALMGPRAELDEADTPSAALPVGLIASVGITVWYERSRISSDWRCASPDAHAMWGAIMLAGRAPRTGTPMDRCGGPGSPHTGAKIAVDVGIVEPNSNSHSARSGYKQSFLNVNAGTRDEEGEKVKRHKVLCNQRGLTFVPIIFTTSGGMGEAFQRQIWHPHWKRVEGPRQRTLR